MFNFFVAVQNSAHSNWLQSLYILFHFFWNQVKSFIPSKMQWSQAHVTNIPDFSPSFKTSPWKQGSHNISYNVYNHVSNWLSLRIKKQLLWPLLYFWWEHCQTIARNILSIPIYLSDSYNDDAICITFHKKLRTFLLRATLLSDE